MADILQFDQCIKMASSKKHLILGNGFSVDLFPNIFNYKKLAEKITDPKLKAIFAKFNTSDFEFVVLKLTESLIVLNYYDSHKLIYNKVYEDAEKLKELLISVISNSHPENPTWITENQYKSCFEFLQHFEEGRKYSFNYDLLLYWVYMHFLDHEATKLICDDGFRTNWDDDSMVTWEIGREHQQNLYYLHGAMHIFKDDKSLIQKYTWRNGNKTIGQQVRESIDNSKFPVFISEGTTEHKLKRIKENGYLSRSFSSLKSIKGDLFIFGHSLRDEDDHVFDIVNSNQGLKRIFISLYGNSDKIENKKIIGKINAWQSEFTSKGREYIFYDSTSANIWGKFD
ncbi:DUF4917 family protein [Solitalea sp. MAHUQ-68]|uniref:DUF4917 family protein n=1 Tax=Solitalea agri TaxID=2953739 RepID=A0A9X2EYP0_9SPHI|nr:DUF4917 family protein [Solitalea agri]MCO4291357.1 DUF4917 family protein [Solitalea agri]